MGSEGSTSVFVEPGSGCNQKHDIFHDRSQFITLQLAGTTGIWMNHCRQLNPRQIFSMVSSQLLIPTVDVPVHATNWERNNMFTVSDNCTAGAGVDNW